MMRSLLTSKRYFFLFLVFLFFSLSINVWGQLAGDYRSSVAAGNWDAPGTWLRYDGFTWVASPDYPGQNSYTSNVTIVNNTRITMSSTTTVRINNLTIQPTGVLIVNGKLTVNGNFSEEFSGNDGALFSLGSGGLTIVNGDATLANKADISIDSHFIVIGTLSGGSQTSVSLGTNADVYVFGNDYINTIVICDTYPSTGCTGGTEAALVNHLSTLPSEIQNIVLSNVSYSCTTTPPTWVTAPSSSGNVCEGGTITLIANASSAVSYRWTGPNGYSVTTANTSLTIPNATLAMSGTYTCTAITSGFCLLTSSAPAVNVFSNTINAPSTTSFCETTGSSNVMIIGSDMGSGTTYQWQVCTNPNNQDAGCYTDISGATSKDYNPGTITNSNRYRRNLSGSCNSTSNIVGFDITPPITSNTISPQAPLSNCGPITEYYINGSYPSGGYNNNFTFQWQSSTDGVNFSNIATATSQGYAPNTISSPIYFRRIAMSGNCSAISNVLFYNTNSTPSAPGAITGSNTVCIPASNVAYSISIVSGATSYTWSYSGTGVSISGTTTNVPVSFASNATSGTLSVVATNSCGTSASSTLVITISPNPTALVLTGSTICASPGNNGTISSATSATGINYTLYNSGGVSQGGAKAGTGSGLTWSGLSAGTGYYALGVNASTGCTSANSNSVNVSTNPNPTAGITNNTGSTILTCSRTAIDVTATGGGTYSWSGGLGTGASASITSPGTYTVTVISANGCSSTSSITLTQDITLPTAYNVTGGGLYCSGGAGVPIGLDNSQSGVNYQLYRDASSVGLPVSGTGSSITFGNQTAVGTYTVKATNSATSCIQDMTSSAIVTVGDTEKPKITQCLPDGTADCVKNVPAGKDTYQGFYDAGGRVTDNCTPFVDLKVTFADVIDPNSGCKLKRTYTIADISGNEATCTQLFTITDTEVPVINSVVNLLVSPNNNSCGASLSVAAPTDVNENCSLVDEGAYYEYTIAGTTKTGHGAISDIFPEGTTLITWTIADVCGHVSLPKTQTVEVAFSLTPFSYDNGSTAIGIGSGVQPMQTSTHDYFVDNKAPESGYTYSWGLYADNGGVPGAAIDPSLYTLSNVNQAHVQLAFKSNIPTNNYIISIIKTKNATTCAKQRTIQITVQSNSSFDVVLDNLGNQCQAPGGGLTTISWNVTFPNVITEPFMFSYSIKLGGTVVASGNITNITYAGAIPIPVLSAGAQTGKLANSWAVVIYYSLYGVSGNDLERTVEIEINATDAYQVSEPYKANNTDDLKIYQVPVITLE